MIWQRLSTSISSVASAPQPGSQESSSEHDVPEGGFCHRQTSWYQSLCTSSCKTKRKQILDVPEGEGFMETAEAYNALIMFRPFYLCKLYFVSQWLEIKSNQNWPAAVFVKIKFRSPKGSRQKYFHCLFHESKVLRSKRKKHNRLNQSWRLGAKKHCKDKMCSCSAVLTRLSVRIRGSQIRKCQIEGFVNHSLKGLLRLPCDESNAV